jgi:hypothetical protein
MNLVRMIVTVIAVFPLANRWGIAGTSVAVLLGVSSCIPFWWRNSAQLIEDKSSLLSKQLLNILLISFVIGVPIFVLKQLFELIGILEFFVLAITALCSYLLFGLLLWKFFRSGPIGIIQEIALSLRPGESSSEI